MASAILLLSLPFASSAGEPKGPDRRLVLVEYNRELKPAEKERSVERTRTLLRDLGIEVVTDPAAVADAVAASHGTISAGPVSDRDRVYDAVYYLTDLARLPAAVHPLFRRIVLVDALRQREPRSGQMRSLPIVWEPVSRSLLVDHRNLNQLELFGNFMHPKVNFAMILETAVEARLAGMGVAALRELGLDILVDNDEWARLNGGRGWSVYTGEEVTFVGWKTAARLTPPGMVIDALRELRSGVPATAYAGLPEANQPWWSPRHGPGADRQNIMRCLFSRSPQFFDRLAGRNGVSEDRVLQEKTRLVLYAAFVASGGALDHAFWARRHPGNDTIDRLTRDFDAGFRERLNRRLDESPDTRGVRIE